MISSGEAIYYIEYLDHGLVSDLEKLEKNPLTLWVVGKIFKEADKFYALVCSGTKFREPTSKPYLEVVQKCTIITMELIHTVE